MIASLPMYDFPEIRDATRAFWSVLVRHFRDQGISGVPSHLVHDQPVNSLWSDKGLFFSQCCGYDVVNRYRHNLSVLATPWFTAPGCQTGDYASAIIVHEDCPNSDVLEMFDKIAVINGPESQSGMNALFSLVAPLKREGKYFSEVRISGSHMASLEAIRNGQADISSIDCVSYEIMRRYRPSAIHGTRRLGLTFAAPAPPYVTRANLNEENRDRIKSGLVEAMADPSLDDIRQILLLDNIKISDTESYDRINREFKHDLRAI